MISDEELNASIQRLRERRSHIPELRDYRPQAHGKGATKASKPTKADVPVLETFGDLFKRGEGGDSDGNS